jgi:endonuclease YncB( thermonuclease family)
MQGEYYIAAAIVAALIVVIANHAQPPPLEQKRKYAVVSFVIDGDTIILRGVQANIRLWGLDHSRKRP